MLVTASDCVWQGPQPVVSGRRFVAPLIQHPLVIGTEYTGDWPGAIASV